MSKILFRIGCTCLMILYVLRVLIVLVLVVDFIIRNRVKVIERITLLVLYIILFGDELLFVLCNVCKSYIVFVFNDYGIV